MPTVEEIVASAHRVRSSTINGRKGRNKHDWVVKESRYPQLNAGTGALMLPCPRRKLKKNA